MRSHLFIVTILLCFGFSCKQLPENVSTTLTDANQHREVLKAVINHYRKEGNEDKLNACYFLIGNMKDKYSLSGTGVTTYDPIFNVLDSLFKRKRVMLTESPLVRAKWDSLTDFYGTPRLVDGIKEFDDQKIPPNILIENIDESYKLWKHLQWNKNITFEQYCESLLPYRIGTERLSPWMKYLNEEFRHFRDTIKSPSLFKFTKAFDHMLRKEISLNHTIDKYPFDMSAKQMEMARRGACRHLVNYEAMVLRANGVPVSIDFTKCWGNSDKGHEWLNLINENGTRYPFNAVQESFEGFSKSPYRFAKVYRKTFRKQIIEVPPNNQDIPQFLFDPYSIDVTSDYCKTTTLKIKLSKFPKATNSHAILCTFGDDWIPQTWSTVDNDYVTFKNIGTDVVYIVMTFHNNKYYPLTNPFIVNSAGKIKYLVVSSAKQDMTLTRKVPYSNLNYRNALCLLNGHFQAANNANYVRSTELYKITGVPTNYVEVMLKPHKFKYIRYLTAPNQKANLAEFEVYGLTRKRDTIKLGGEIQGFPVISEELGTPFQNAFDGKPETYFSGDNKTTSWAGYHFTTPQNIVKIRFCPRSDTNFIMVGDKYELFLYKDGGWASLGQKKATSQTIIFADVPSNALYLLKDCNRGREARIFTYENGKQIWW